jgi:putative aminopeptidase FrvX
VQSTEGRIFSKASYPATGPTQPEQEADQSHLPSVGVKNEYLHSPLHGMHKDDFAATYNTAEHYMTGYTKHITEK